jgi:asparaginyl-tRNA synthetase
MIRPGHYIADILRKAPGDQVIAHGWVRTHRNVNNVHFIQLSDGLSPIDLQVVVESDTFPAEIMTAITTGASLGVEGNLVPSLGKGQLVELKAYKLMVHGTADPDEYPLQKKQHNLELLRELGNFRSRTKTLSAVGDSRVLRGARILIRAYAPDLDFRCRRCRLNVSSYHT